MAKTMLEKIENIVTNVMSTSGFHIAFNTDIRDYYCETFYSDNMDELKNEIEKELNVSIDYEKWHKLFNENKLTCQTIKELIDVETATVYDAIKTIHNYCSKHRIDYDRCDCEFYKDKCLLGNVSSWNMLIKEK